MVSECKVVKNQSFLHLRFPLRALSLFEAFQYHNHFLEVEEIKCFSGKKRIRKGKRAFRCHATQIAEAFTDNPEPVVEKDPRLSKYAACLIDRWFVQWHGIGAAGSCSYGFAVPI
jgi:hypothetical protein